MSQRLHNYVNSVNMMEALHCETYAARLAKRGKPEPVLNRLCQQPKRERSISRNRPSAPAQNVHHANSKPKSANVRPSGDLKSDSLVPNIIHRELYTDNPALVEVTVKTHNAKPRSQGNSRSNSRSRSREPWSKLLKHPSNDNLSSFHNFDPLRTIHFLAKELQSKLVDSSDRAIQQMVLDMQQALNRVPPEVASSVLLHTPRDPPRKKPSYGDFKRPKSNSKENEDPHHDDKVIVVVKAPTKEIGCQTMKSIFETEKLQKHLEESSAKIETACKQMETVCTRLKSEKEELEIRLRAEKETVKFLRKQIEDVDNDKLEIGNNKIQSLQQERDNLQSQIKKLKNQLDAQQDFTTLELKTAVQDLRKQKNEADEQIAILDHQLTLVSMEREKYVAILSARDRQIKEIRCEMTQLQEVVNEQLVELQNAPCSSVPSSASNVTSEQTSWPTEKPDNMHKADMLDNLTPTSINTNESTLEQLFLKDKMPTSSFKELPSGDSSGTTVIKEVKKTMKNRKDVLKKQRLDEKQSKDMGNIVLSETHANIRDMFAEIKKQALMVTGSSQHQKMNDADKIHEGKTSTKM